MTCDEFFEPLNALLDGELPPAEAQAMQVHLSTCPACAKLFSELRQLRADLATAIPAAEAPAELRARIEAMLDAETKPATDNIIPFTRKPARRGKTIGWVAAAAAVAAMLVFTVLPHQNNTADLISVRDAALQPSTSGNPISTANGPPVPGFQLTSLRNDTVAGHPALIAQYTANGQVFTLCVWPAYNVPPHGKRYTTYKGMNISDWADGDQEYWAASTAPAPQFKNFIAALSAS